MSTLSNIDTVKIVGRSGGGPQITMQQKLTPDPECRTIPNSDLRTRYFLSPGGSSRTSGNLTPPS